MIKNSLLSNPILKMAKLNGQAEIFHSIQGEGKSIGKPAVFVRTSLCNLHCVWCDTDYTWNWTGTRFEHQFDQTPGYQKYDKTVWIAQVPVAEIAKIISEYPCRRVILTGGEPMLQQPALVQLMLALRAIQADYIFEVETNGTMRPIADFDAAIDQYNVSPKLENSGNPKKLREKAAPYRFFAQSPKSNFKFVVSEKKDLQEVLDIVQQYQIPKDKIWLMPEGLNRQTLTRRRKWLVEVCKTEGFQYSDRLHIQIWGSKKGV